MKIIRTVFAAFLFVPLHIGVAESNYRHEATNASNYRHEATKRRLQLPFFNPEMIGPLFMWAFRRINSWLFDHFLFGLMLSCDRPCISDCTCDGLQCEVPSGSWFGTCQPQPTSFRDVTDDVLPPYTQTGVLGLDPNKTPIAAGVCTLDVDRDGLPDLYFASGQGFPNALMRNTGKGEFENVSEEWKATYSNNSALSCLAVDLDNDGCDDLVLTGAYTGSNFTGNLLLRNTYCDDGTFGFSDKTPDILRQWPYTVSSSAADIDNDGLLDIFVSSLPALVVTFPEPIPLEYFPGSSLLLHNRGGFQFEDITEGSGVGHPMCPCMVLFLDYDNDGFVDIIAINCGNDTLRTFSMQLYRNNGDLTFQDVTVDAGFGPDSPRGMWMGGGVGDFNADGCLDFASTNLANDVLWNDSDPRIFLGSCQGENPGFTAEPVSIEPHNFAIDMTLFAWGPIVRDFDNNGILDMFWTGNYLVATVPFEDLLSVIPHPDIYAEAEVLFGNGPDAEYKFRAEPLPTDLRKDYHVVMTSGDYNGDGALDIVVAIDGFISGPRQGRPAVFYGIPSGNNWIGIRLVGTSDTVNLQAIGAVVHLYKKENKTDGSARRAEQTLILSAGSASMTTEEKTLFFGVGLETVDQFEVKVLWPGGGPEWFDGFGENGIVTLTEGTGTTDSMFLP